jgi:hypothetical protein
MKEKMEISPGPPTAAASARAPAPRQINDGVGVQQISVTTPRAVFVPRQRRPAIRVSPRPRPSPILIRSNSDSPLRPLLRVSLHLC